MTRLLVTADAEADLEDIALYIARDNPSAALKLTGGMRQAFSAIAASPQGFQLREELGSRARLMTFGSYVIVYDHDPLAGQATVLRVVHGARDLPRLLRP